MPLAILIDPYERTVSEIQVPEFVAEIRRKHEIHKLSKVARLPRGDSVYVAEEAKDSSALFSLGGSAPFAGYGLVLGRRGDFGVIQSVSTDVDDVISLAAFAER